MVSFLSSPHIRRRVASFPEDIDLEASAGVVGLSVVVSAVMFAVAAVISATSAARSCPSGGFAVVDSFLAEDYVDLFNIGNSLAKVSFTHFCSRTGAALEKELSIT